MTEQIPIQWLEAFVRFAEAGHVVRAAAKLGLTQPALSKQLRQLEERMPGKLFFLHGRNKRLTPFGRDLFQRLQPRFAQLPALVSEAWASHASAASARLRIAGRRGVLERISGRLRFPGQLDFLELPSGSVARAVAELSVDIGVTHQVPDSLELTAKLLLAEEFQLAIPKKLLGTKPSLQPELFTRLSELPFLAYKPEDELLLAVGRHFGVAPRKWNVSRSAASYPAIAEMVSAELGWAILPSYLPLAGQRYWVLPLPGRVLPPRKFFLVYRPEFAGIPWFKDLAAEIKACFGP